MGRLLRLVLVVLVFAPSLAAARADALMLDPGATSFDGWSVVRVLPDPDRVLSIAEAVRHSASFERPTVPQNNFGQRAGALWLHVPIVQASDRDRWVVELDYPPLNEIDLYVVRDGALVHYARLGNRVPKGERPMRTRAHAEMLDLPDKGRYDVYLRVVTVSAMVVPIGLHDPDAFIAKESGRLLLQGLMFGVALMLMATTVAYGFSLRDRVFAHYALIIVGVSTFFVSYSGLGHQFLWSTQVGWFEKVSPWGALLAMAAGCLFVESTLGLRSTRPVTAQVLRSTALVGVGAIGASMLGLLDYRATALAATVLGPVPTVIALRESIPLALAGNRMAVYMVVGWGAYAIGATSMAAVLRGWAPADLLMQHLFQIASVIEMLAWMRVLGLRIEHVRREAERANAEKSALVSLAHSDALTGLPNRRGLAAALEAALPHARADAAIAVYLIDLDGFKAVNDRLGHDVGDELLVQVGKRLREVLRHDDVVARLGGDEFVVLSRGITGEAAAMRIGQKMLDAFREPFVVLGHSCAVGLTIGFALAPHDGNEASDLLRRADAAMYAGKQGGRGAVRRGAASVGLAAS